jgi:hypothetical protein
MINNLVGGLFGKIVDNAEGILDKVITTDKERDEAKLALKKLLLDAEREAFAKEVEDRKSAMSAKVNTIIDFFFGGSSKKNEQIKEK